MTGGASNVAPGCRKPHGSRTARRRISSVAGSRPEGERPRETEACHELGLRLAEAETRALLTEACEATGRDPDAMVSAWGRQPEGAR